MDELIRLLTEFGVEDELVALCRRIGSVEEPLTDDDLTLIEVGLLELADNDEASAALLGEAADAVVAVRDEQQTRLDAAEAEEAERQAAIARMRGDEPADETPPEQEPGEGDEPPDEGDGGEDEGAPAEQEPEAVAASATPRARRTVRRRAETMPQDHDDQRSHNRILAAMDVPRSQFGPGVRVGQELASVTEIGLAVANRCRVLKGRESDKLPVASVQAEYPPQRRLTDDPVRNAELVAAALREGNENWRSGGAARALVAAGGFCGPRTPYYGQITLGDTGRPVRDALVGFQANRGGVSILPPPSLAGLANAVGVWTTTDDATAVSDANHVKNKLALTCANPVDTDLEAVTAYLQVGNFMARNNPERVAAFVDLSMVQQARIAEQTLLATIKTGSTKPASITASVGFARDFFNTLEQAASGLRTRHRMAIDAPLRILIPDIAEAMLRYDITLGVPGGAPGENVGLADAEIARWFATRSINVTWTRDFSGAIFGTQTATNPLRTYPQNIEYALYPEGSWLFLDGGTLDVGPIRDSVTTGQNNYQQFAESFEAAALIGPESLWITQDACLTGGSVGTFTPDCVGS